HNASEKFETHGIELSKLNVNMKQMIKRKNEVVEQTVGGLDYLMKKNKIDVFHGHGTFEDKNTILVSKEDGSEEKIETDKVIIATGSKPIIPDEFNYDKERSITSTEALNIEEVPKKMVIIGGGYIGLEMGSVYARLGTQVEVVEFLDRIIPNMDKDCSKELMRVLKKLGIKFHLKHKVTNVKINKKSVTVEVEERDGDETFKLNVDYCLIAIGRRPYTHNLGLDKIGVETDDKGRIEVDDHLQTKVEGIYAIGDVIRGAMLAHKAEEEGIFVAEVMAGQKPHVDYNLIPGVVYTWPEVASVGKTEEQLKEEEIPYKSGKFPFKALGRARASTDTEGMVKILSHEETDEILGVHMVGPRAADMIAEAVVAMEYRASAEDIARISHAHPTFTEAVKEAALAATGDRPIHM
ncbi:MAG: dihydrolipoyl dehydrogenase, partial [Saprospiraceae bacterium]|nr:dihydrolipoyl dehydrogenase [Saprospiraceae bacterium]